MYAGGPVVSPPARQVPAPELRRVQAGLVRAAQFLCDFPREQLRFDAAIGTSAAWRLVPLPALDCARRRACQVADRDQDNPLRRFFDPEVHVRRKAVRGWQVPEQGRINTNRPVGEALWCDRYPLRPQTLKYIVEAMPDGGGFHSTHALWALIIARNRGCLTEKRFQELSTSLRRELRHAQAREFAEGSTREIDLFAERALFLALAGETRGIASWIGRLLVHQNPDGSFGKGKHSYHRYHATMTSNWLLAWWLQRHQGR